MGLFDEVVETLEQDAWQGGCLVHMRVVFVPDGPTRLILSLVMS